MTLDSDDELEMHICCASRAPVLFPTFLVRRPGLPAKLMTRDRLSRALIIQAIITSRNTVPEI
jgi:hypothetical protein